MGGGTIYIYMGYIGIVEENMKTIMPEDTDLALYIYTRMSLGCCSRREFWKLGLCRGYIGIRVSQN